VTSPPQPPRKPLIVDDLDLGINAALPPPVSGKRKAANDRQRKAAEEEAAYQRWRAAMVEDNWGPQ
jgi:hypothetical protein